MGLLGPERHCLLVESPVGRKTALLSCLVGTTVAILLFSWFVPFLLGAYIKVPSYGHL